MAQVVRPELSVATHWRWQPRRLGLPAARLEGRQRPEARSGLGRQSDPSQWPAAVLPEACCQGGWAPAAIRLGRRARVPGQDARPPGHRGWVRAAHPYSGCRRRLPAWAPRASKRGPSLPPGGARVIQPRLERDARRTSRRVRYGGNAGGPKRNPLPPAGRQALRRPKVAKSRRSPSASLCGLALKAPGTGGVPRAGGVPGRWPAPPKGRPNSAADAGHSPGASPQYPCVDCLGCSSHAQLD